VAHKANKKGERQQLTPAEKCVAIHLEWEGIERVDSTVGELFGAIIAVLGASGSRELMDLTVVVKLDNKGVVDHFNRGGTSPQIRQRLKQHARGLWNVLHFLVRLRNKTGKGKTKVVFVWVRARHNQLETEECSDWAGNDLADELAKVALFSGDPRCDGSVVWKQGSEVPVDREGGRRTEWAWPLGELEAVVFLTDTDGQQIPVTSDMRRSVLRYGLQRERLSKFAKSSKRAKALVQGIKSGEMKVIRGKDKAAWGVNMQHPTELATVIAGLLELGFDMAPIGTACGRSYRRAVQPTSCGDDVRCGMCSKEVKSRHVMRCHKFKAGVAEAEMEGVLRAAFTHGKVGKAFGHVKGQAASWHGVRGREESEVGEREQHRTGGVLSRQGRLEASEWGKEQTCRQTSRVLGEFVQLPAGLMMATAAAMGGKMVGDQKGLAEDMARAACMVPSMMAVSTSRQRRALRLLVGWATLESKRPYPLDVLGWGTGRTQMTTTSAWRKRKVRVRVRWAEGEEEAGEALEQEWEFQHTVQALEVYVADKWGRVDVVDVSTLVTHGGGWGDEDPDRQLAKSMQLGRLWGAEQGWAEVQIRRRAKPALLWSAVFRVRSNCGCSTAG
jgi:hypothetical protein